MYAISVASGESLALETGLSVNVRFGSVAAIHQSIRRMAAFGGKAVIQNPPSQASVCSAISSASTISIPKYLTVLSSLG